MTTGRSISLAVILWAALTAFVQVAQAQGGPDGEALLAAGNESLEAGKFTAAAQQFSRAMRSDTLSNAQIARALFLRGVALKNDGKPAQAIADLDSALWLQGLSNKDLAQAYLARGEAYQQVGMGDRASADLQRAKEVDPNAAPLVARSAPPADSQPQDSAAQPQAQAQQSASRSRPDNTSLRAQLPGFPNVEEVRPFRQPAPAPPRKEEGEQVASFQNEVKSDARPEPQPVPNFRTSIMPEEKRAAPPPAPSAPSARPAPAAPSQWSTSVSGETKEEESSGGVRSRVSSFFSGVWGGDKKEEAEEQPAAAPEQPSAQSWSQSTQVASTENTPAAAPGSASSGSGGYRIQLASLRTEEEAQAAWQQISARHGSLLAGHPHVIEKTSVGNLGTFYRIQIGPFADKAQSAQLCKTLQSSGVDCFLVAR